MAVQRSQNAGEPSMDEILASIRKIIAEDPKPAPAEPVPSADHHASRAAPRAPQAPPPPGGLGGRIEPRLTLPNGPPPTAGDRRIAADLDRELADLLHDGPASPPQADRPTLDAPVGPAFEPPRAAGGEVQASDQKLAKPGWLSGNAAPPPAPEATPPGPGGTSDARRPAPLTEKMELARTDRPAAPRPLPPLNRPAPIPFQPAPRNIPAAGGTAAAPLPPNKPLFSPAGMGGTAETKPASPVPTKPPVDKAPTTQPAPPPAAAEPKAAQAAPAAAVSSNGVAKPAGVGAASHAAAPEKPASSSPTGPVRAIAAEAISAALPATAGDVQIVTAAVRSVDDLIADLLRPMLRQWLDQNMPRILEKALRIELAQGLALPSMPGALAAGDKSKDKTDKA